MPKNKRTAEDAKLGFLLDKELISLYAEQYGITHDQAKRTVESVFELSKHVLITNSMLSIRGFGIFRIKSQRNARYRDVHTGMMQQIALIRKIAFTPSRSLKDVINGKTKGELERYIKKQSKIKKEMKRAGLIRD